MSTMLAVDGLLFDACNILYDDTAWRRWLLRVLRRLGMETSHRSFFRVWDRDYLDDVHRGQRPFCEALRAFLLSVGLSPAQIDEVEAACHARRHTEASVRPLTGVPGTIRRLRESGMVLAVACNSEDPALILRQRLDRLGLGHLLTTVVSSVDLAQTMPEAGCYEAALAGMKLPAHRVAFVGHDAGQLAGAARLGMPTIAFNCDADALADVYLQRFENLLELVVSRPLAAAA
jgi:FMN phosphatase YigB (HAD superfamily)